MFDSHIVSCHTGLQDVAMSLLHARLDSSTANEGTLCKLLTLDTGCCRRCATKCSAPCKDNKEGNAAHIYFHLVLELINLLHLASVTRRYTACLHDHLCWTHIRDLFASTCSTSRTTVEPLRWVEQVLAEGRLGPM